MDREIHLHFAQPADDARRTSPARLYRLGREAFKIVHCPFTNWRFCAADAIAAVALHGVLVVGTPVHLTAQR
jgi:hypothetical protein